MNNIFIYFFVAIGLSMDAFSLALVYGINKIKFSKIICLSIFVGIFHFCMPMIGSKFGNLLKTSFLIKANILVGIVFIIIALSMLNSLKEEDTPSSLTNIFSLLVFSFTVSIDSLSIGVAYGILKENMIISSLIFSIVSGIFTFIGLIIGKKIGSKYQIIAKIVGSIILILLAIRYIFN